MQGKYSPKKKTPPMQIWPDEGQSSHREIDYTAEPKAKERIRGQFYIQGLTG